MSMARRRGDTSDSKWRGVDPRIRDASVWMRASVGGNTGSTWGKLLKQNEKRHYKQMRSQGATTASVLKAYKKAK